MAKLHFETVLSAPIDRVWDLHEDVHYGLLALSPPEQQVTIESADLPVQCGSVITLSAKGPFGPVRWVATIVEHRPPHGVITGREARFVDEQASGPFKFWRHEHEFEAIDSQSTRMVDRVSYSVGWGLLGWIADWLLVRRQVQAMFRHRHATAHRLLDQRPDHRPEPNPAQRPGPEPA